MFRAAAYWSQVDAVTRTLQQASVELRQAGRALHGAWICWRKLLEIMCPGILCVNYSYVLVFLKFLHVDFF